MKFVAAFSFHSIPGVVNIMKIGHLGGKIDKIMERQPENRNFHLIFGIFELKKIRELANCELDNPRISAP